MAPRTPNYSFERSQRERAQQAKSQKKSDLRAEKSAKRKEARGEGESETPIGPSGQPDAGKE